MKAHESRSESISSQKFAAAVALAIGATWGCSATPVAETAVTQPEVTPTTEKLDTAETVSLSVGLYPYVPRLEQFRTTIATAWAKSHPDVAIDFVGTDQWDGGYSNDPSGMDVFVFDAIFLDYFQEKGYLNPLTPAEIPNAGDFLPYALGGVKKGDNYAALPMLGCANILFYRDGDPALDAAKTLTAVNKAVGSCSYTSQIPPDERGLMLDLAGGTTNACMYVDTAQSIDGTWPVPLPTEPAQLNPQAIASMQHLLTDASYYNATEDAPNDPYGRGKWFSEGQGRALMGFTESMSFMDSNTLAKIQFKLFPLGDDAEAQPLFYSDVIAVSATTTQRALAVELAQLMASSDVLVESFKGEGAENPQYLMPVRKSVFSTLSADYPLYSRMRTMVEGADPILFNLGTTVRTWIDSMKSAIKTASRKGYSCGCDEKAPSIASQGQASEICPGICAEHGGWSGQWTNYPPGGTNDWAAACGCKSCSID